MNLESSFNEDDETLEKNIFHFMHFKEMDQFKDQYINQSDKNNNEMIRNYMEESTMRTVHCMNEYDSCEEDDEFYSNNLFQKDVLKFAWKNKWDKISDAMDRLRDEGDIEITASNYTSILNYHLTHNINLDIKCFPALFYCNMPRVVQKLFDKNLIEAEDKKHFKCLFDYDSLLNKNFFLVEVIEYKYLANLFISYTILFYKLPIQNYKKLIIKCLTKLAEILLTDLAKEKMADLTFKALLLSAILNGVFTVNELKTFLENSHVNPILSDNDSDTNSEDLSISDEEMDFDDVMDQLHHRRLHGGQLPNNVKKTSIGDRIEVKNEGIFPLSLKNLARIKIKHSMIDYSIKNVDKLELLPQVLKDYVQYKQEIHLILKYATNS